MASSLAEAPSTGVTADPVKSSIEMRRAPVPLLTRPRPPVEPPAAAVAPAVKEPATKPEEGASDDFGAKAAKAAVEADGYKGVKMLRRDANGVWRATGLRGKTVVMLTVDAQGNVAAE